MVLLINLKFITSFVSGRFITDEQEIKSIFKEECKSSKSGIEGSRDSLQIVFDKLAGLRIGKVQIRQKS